MVKPYYEQDGIQIWLGDCHEILPSLQVDLVLADPPYGIGYVHGAINIPHATKFAGVKVTGDSEPFDLAWLLRYPNLVLWGANHYADRLPVERWLAWDKRCGVIPERDTSDCEFAWARGTGGNCAREARVHPTQKPVALMIWCLGFYPAARREGLVAIDGYRGVKL